MDWQEILTYLKSKYKCLTYASAQLTPEISEDDFNVKKSELLADASEIMEYWNNVVTKMHVPIPPTVSKEFSNLRYEMLTCMEYYNKFMNLRFFK